jgi:hypothetical protein
VAQASLPGASRRTETVRAAVESRVLGDLRLVQPLFVLWRDGDDEGTRSGYAVVSALL